MFTFTHCSTNDLLRIGTVTGLDDLVSATGSDGKLAMPLVLV